MQVPAKCGITSKLPLFLRSSKADQSLAPACLIGTGTASKVLPCLEMGLKDKEISSSPLIRGGGEPVPGQAPAVFSLGSCGGSGMTRLGTPGGTGQARSSCAGGAPSSCAAQLKMASASGHQG